MDGLRAAVEPLRRRSEPQGRWATLSETIASAEEYFSLREGKPVRLKTLSGFAKTVLPYLGWKGESATGNDLIAATSAFLGKPMVTLAGAVNELHNHFASSADQLRAKSAPTPAPASKPAPAAPVIPAPAPASIPPAYKPLAAPAAAPVWTLASLSAMVEAVFGKSQVRAILTRPYAFSIDPKDSAALVENSVYATERRNERLRAEAKRRPQPTEAEDFERLRRWLFEAGVSVPGLSYSGLSVRRNASDNRVNPRQLPVAEAGIKEFCEAMAGTTAGALSQHRAARAARDFVCNATGEYKIQS